MFRMEPHSSSFISRDYVSLIASGLKIFYWWTLTWVATISSSLSSEVSVCWVLHFMFSKEGFFFLGVAKSFSIWDYLFYLNDLVCSLRFLSYGSGMYDGLGIIFSVWMVSARAGHSSCNGEIYILIFDLICLVVSTFTINWDLSVFFREVMEEGRRRMEETFEEQSYNYEQVFFAAKYYYSVRTELSNSLTLGTRWLI